MRKLKPVLIASPAFVLGSFLTATLTTTAKAGPTPSAHTWEYRIVETQSELNRWGGDGFEYCGESAMGTGNSVSRTYTMRRRK